MAQGSPGSMSTPSGSRAGFLRLKQSPRCHFHLVFATTIGIGVIGHVTDVGDVHHMANVIPKQLERASKHVGVEEGPEVSDVGVVVDRRARRNRTAPGSPAGSMGTNSSWDRVNVL